ncbi:hypothetical protein BHM03_00007093 [Ensete ventricosum]|nr:hypothetical protein BHM03_00007093 [Ensete ventricosum]
MARPFAMATRPQQAVIARGPGYRQQGRLAAAKGAHWCDRLWPRVPISEVAHNYDNRLRPRAPVGATASNCDGSLQQPIVYGCGDC